jgi:SSS family solute:Na+ symporter
MFIGMVFLLFYIYSATGDISSAHQSLTDMASMVPANLKAIGHQGWTASPASFSPLWWIVYSSLVLGVGIGVLAQPQLVVRFMTVRTNKELNRAVLIGGIFILVTVATALIV